MFRNYLTAALRNLRKHAGYSAINLAGLAVGLLVTLQILLFVSFELSYDNFHTSPENLYRIVLDGKFSGTDIHAPLAPAPMSAALVQDFPEVVTAVRIFGFSGEQLVSRDEMSSMESKILRVDSSFFDVFSFAMLQGNPETALTRPQTLVLTQTLARKYFGDNDPVGETLIVGDTTRFEVTGVVADPPANTHIKFSMLISMNGLEQSEDDQWISNNFFTYIRLRPGSSKSTFEAQLPAFFERYAAPQVEEIFGKSYDEILGGESFLGYSLQPIRDVHLKSDFDIDLEPAGDIQYVFVFIAIALFILLLACINFMNLATARSASRAKEVGIRKVVGSYRSQLIAQFLSESTILAVIAMVLAIGGLFLTTPLFNQLTDQSLRAADLLSPVLLTALFGGSLLVGVIAGSYPALYLSSISPASILQSHSSSGRQRSRLRNGLVVFQFGISIALLLATFIVGDQLSFIRAKRLGFDKEHILVIERAGILEKQSEAFKDRLRSYAAILAVGGTTNVPGGLHGVTVFQPEGFGLDELVLMAPVFVDNDFVEAMGIEMAEGRDFSAEHPGDSSAFIINESALGKIGWDSADGRTIGTFGSDNSIAMGPILGVIKNYNYASLRNKVGPMGLRFGSFAMPFLIVRFGGEDPTAALDFVSRTWKEFVPERPLKYSFLNETYDRLFASDRRLGRLFSTFAVLAIFIAGLGLFGLGLFVTEQRTKEIGVRKALGASVGGIVFMLSNQFTRLVVLAIIIALPAAYFAMNSWLDGFSYRTDIQISSFLFSAGITLAIAWLTVSFQAIRAAVADPIDALRYE